jgi:mannose-6-phosphate isomerase-like protein (cupin superfamily)
MNMQLIPKEFDHMSPAGAEIRLLMNNAMACVVHCTLRKGKITKAVTHKTVSEFWHIISGNGEIWRRQGSKESITPLVTGVTIDIPLGADFQYRSDNNTDLVFICFTMPLWSGADEAIYIEKGAWQPT